MIIKELEKIVQEEKAKGSLGLYIRNLLKEYLQIYILYYVYISREYQKNLIFTGGTCLRHFYNLGRLSEDLDFDYMVKFDTKVLQGDMIDFFAKKYRYKVMSSLKQQGKQILFKFPVLYDLDLATKEESNLLYVKIDLSENQSKHHESIVSSKSKFGFNFVAVHYDLDNLMAGKIHAILTRQFLKGRDYFDLLFFLKNSTQPNLKRLSDLLGQEVTKVGLEKMLDDKVEELVANHKNDFQSDLTPLISNPDILNLYINNYKNEYFRNKKNVF